MQIQLYYKEKLMKWNQNLNIYNNLNKDQMKKNYNIYLNKVIDYQEVNKIILMQNLLEMK